MTHSSPNAINPLSLQFVSTLAVARLGGGNQAQSGNNPRCRCGPGAQCGARGYFNKTEIPSLRWWTSRDINGWVSTLLSYLTEGARKLSALRTVTWHTRPPPPSWVPPCDWFSVGFRCPVLAVWLAERRIPVFLLSPCDWLSVGLLFPPRAAPRRVFVCFLFLSCSIKL